MMCLGKLPADSGAVLCSNTNLIDVAVVRRATNDNEKLDTIIRRVKTRAN